MIVSVRDPSVRSGSRESLPRIMMFVASRATTGGRLSAGTPVKASTRSTSLSTERR